MATRKGPQCPTTFKLIITGTFAIVTLAWVLTHADGVASITTALATNYSTAVGALKPS